MAGVGGFGGRPVGHPKTGGRQKGTPNKRSAAAKELLDGLDFDPLQEMVRIAQDQTVSPDLRFRASAELAPYVYPKLKALEISKDADGDPPLLTIEAFEQLYQKCKPAGTNLGSAPDGGGNGRRS